MKIHQLFLVLMISLGLLSCDHCMKGSGDFISVQRQVSDFDKIHLQGDFKLFIREESIQNVTVHADDNIAPLIRTEVSNGELDIFLRSEKCIKKKSQVTIYVSVPHLDRIKLNGSGVIESQNKLTGNSLEVILEGSGLMDIATEANEVAATLKGSGQIKLAGESESGNFRIDGSGYLNAGALRCQNVDASITGSGNIDSYAEDFIKARITGSGRIGYYGNPVVDASVTGSGYIGKN